MRTLKTRPRARKVFLGLFFPWAGLTIATSGPRTVEGLTGPVESSSVAPTEVDAPTDAHAPPEADATAEPSPLDDPPEVLWQVLAGMNYMSGEISAELQEFVGKEVKIPGFMVPLEDFAENVSEFLLVPYVGACVHTPPPPPNQLVFVQMNGEDKVPVTYWDPIWIRGTLEIEETTNMYGQVSFKVSGIEVEPYVW